MHHKNLFQISCLFVITLSSSSMQLKELLQDLRKSPTAGLLHALGNWKR